MGKKIPKAVHHGRKNPQSMATSKENAPLLQNAVPIVKNPIRLTISILVSNRMDTVRKCLNSIKPLLDALPSELIVVDTVGPERSDGSLAVAREYTDKIVHFDWCDDFSAARNAGLKLAKGEWFLYLDDDEWFDDVSAIIDFLKTDDPKYNVCLYRVRNYMDRGGQQYTDGYAERLVRRSEGLHFKDRIHEYLVGATPPIKTLDAFVHHYGYVFDSREDFESHYLRNSGSLEKMLSEQPGCLRAVMHLAQEYISYREYSKAEDLCREALEGNAFSDVSNYCSALAFFYIYVLVSKKKWKEVLDQSERLLKRSDISDLAKANICFQRSECAYAIFDSEKLLSNVDEYFRWLDILDANPDKLAAQQMLSLGTCALESSRASIMESGLKMAADVGDEEHSWAYIRRIAKNPGEGHLILEKCMPRMVRFSADTDSFEKLYALIKPHLEKSSSLSCFLSSVQSWLEPVKGFGNQARLVDFLTGLPLEKPYIVLLKMRAAEKARDIKKLAELFDQYFDLEDVGFAREILQLAYRNGLDLSKCAGKIHIDQWDSDMRLLADACSMDQARGVLRYLRGFFSEDSPEVLSLKTALDLKALKEDQAEDSLMRSEALRLYIERLYAYNLALYNPENFAERRINCLGVGAQAAYYLKRSVDCGRTGDLEAQVRMLRRALDLKSDLVGFVEMMMDNLENQIEQKKRAPKAQANAEFQALAARLKSVVAEFIKKGDTQNARNVLDQLNQILPGDPSILEMYGQLNQSPALRED